MFLSCLYYLVYFVDFHVYCYFYLSLSPSLYSLFSSVKNRSTPTSSTVLFQTLPTTNHHPPPFEYCNLQMLSSLHFRYSPQLLDSSYLIFYLCPNNLDFSPSMFLRSLSCSHLQCLFIFVLILFIQNLGLELICASRPINFMFEHHILTSMLISLSL